jgi:hypothetical protein
VLKHAAFFNGSKITFLNAIGSKFRICCIIASLNIQIDNNCSWVNYCIGIYEAPLIASNKKASLKARPCIKHFVIYFFFVSARPNGLFFAKSTNTGAATKIDE